MFVGIRSAIAMVHLVTVAHEFTACEVLPEE